MNWCWPLLRCPVLIAYLLSVVRRRLPRWPMVQRLFHKSTRSLALVMPDVAAAKRRVFGTVGIDMIAGPSEILVVCDGTTNPDWIAMDLFSQAGA